MAMVRSDYDGNVADARHSSLCLDTVTLRRVLMVPSTSRERGGVEQSMPQYDDQWYLNSSRCAGV